MNRIILLGLSILNIAFANAQARTNVWILGTQISGNNLGLDFNGIELDTFSSFHKLTSVITNTTICDTMGNLLFYTNGTYIANKNHDTLYNSKNFNPGYLTDVYYEGSGLGVAQGVLVLPSPVNSDIYYIFSESGEEIYPPNGYDVQPLELRYSIIDISLDSSLGGIEAQKKKIAIINDTLCTGKITACKHANGRDWWIIVRKYLSNQYYKLLMTPDTILVFEQKIGFVFSKNDALGMSVFSPHGDYYASINNDDTLQVMKFDRCNGEFSDPILIGDMDTVWTHGCQFSSSGRFLYVSSYLHIFQFDIWATDIASSRLEVATYEAVFGSPRWFGLMQLAPDNKIYISTYGGNTCLHSIENPDSLGLSCNVIQSSVVLPSYNSLSLPNFPNYDLGPLQGSPCDTLYLGSNEHLINGHSFRISPNPASDWFNIVYETDDDISFVITDGYGREVKRLTLYPWFKNRIVYVDELPAGVYLLTLSSQSRKQTMKLIVAK
jgi:hypothetical protein